MAFSGHVCVRYLRRGRCAVCERTIEDIRGPKLADVRTAIAGFNMHGLKPLIAFDGHGAREQADLTVRCTAEGWIEDVLVTPYGLTRLRETPPPDHQVELAPAEASAAVTSAFARLVTGNPVPPFRLAKESELVR